jgi:hypothetical protein
MGFGLVDEGSGGDLTIDRGGHAGISGRDFGKPDF